MGIRNFEYITTELNDGATNFPVSLAGSVRTIPTLASGEKPKYVKVFINPGTAGNIVGVMPTYGATTTEATSIPIQPAEAGRDNAESIVFQVHGFSHIASILYAGGTADNSITVVAFSDF